MTSVIEQPKQERLQLEKRSQLSEAKKMLARILAGENLFVEYSAEAKTAFFNTQSRVLVLPAWSDASEDLIDMLTAHEVGHALDTPADTWQTLGRKKDPLWMGILNVCEDVRIEKNMKRRYSGLKLTFPRGYRELMKRDFFQFKKLGDDLTKFSIADRLNIYGKVGFLLEVPFSKEEIPLVDEFEATETFEEVIDLTEKVYQLMKKEQEQAPQQPQDQNGQSGQPQKGAGDQSDQKGKGDKSGDQKGSGKPEAGDGESQQGSGGQEAGDGQGGEPGEAGDGSEGSGGKPGEGPAGAKKGKQMTKSLEDFSFDEEDEDAQKAKGKGEGGDGEGDGEEGDEQGFVGPGGFLGGRNIVGADMVTANGSGATKGKVTTTETINKALETLKNAKLGGRYLYVDPDYPLYQHVYVPWKSFQPIYDKYRGEDMHAAHLERTLPAVNYMFKEFETRRKASEYKRTLQSKKGGLDVRRIHRYRFDDQIFKIKQIEQTGKNHGIVILVDFSGSMSDVMPGVMEQLATLTGFFRKARVAYEVIGFTDSFGNRGYGSTDTNNIMAESQLPINRGNKKPKENPAILGKVRPAMRNMRLVNLLSSDMRAREHKAAVNSLMDQFGGRGSNQNLGFTLGGTPLDESVAAMISFIGDYRRDKRLDVVHLVTITDGQGGAMSCTDSTNTQGTGGGSLRGHGSNGWSPTSGAEGSVLVDVNTRKTFRVERGEGVYFTSLLYRYIREVCDVNVVGFYLTGSFNNFHEIKGMGYVKNVFKEPTKEKPYIIECGGQSVTFSVTSAEVQKGGRDVQKGFLRTFIEMIAE